MKRTSKKTGSPRKARSTPQPADEALSRAIRDSLSPEAVATIVAHLQPALGHKTTGPEIRWFISFLTKLVGGKDALAGLLDEVGL